MKILDEGLKGKNIHLMGAGGAGMSALAILLDKIGARVSACDLVSTAYARRLEDAGIPVMKGHDTRHIDEFMPDIVVYSSALPKDHPEILKAWQRGIQVARRAEILSKIFNERRGVGVAGTHGKTTTSSMISLVAEKAGIDPTIAIGGEVLQLGTNAKLGKGEYMAAELDESDRSFVYFHPEIAVVTNIDWDHRDHYMTFKSVTDAFDEFLSNVKESGKTILCMEDAGIRKLREEYKIKTQIITYGYGNNHNWGAADVNHREGGGVSYTLLHDGEEVGDVELSVSGDHNVLNSLAAYAACYEMGIPHEQIVQGLKYFGGAKRRLQKTGEIDNILIYDDYGHHPNEITATLSTIRKIFGGRRVVAIFQPHRFSRTAALYKEFARALSLADRTFILPIYGSDEQPIDGVSSKLILDAADDDTRSHYELSEDFEDLISSVCRSAKCGDIILTLGAGSVGTLGKKILEKLAEMQR
ncbi:MAG: UDP-N-acetylmuramate--L-alanine ligase [Synergistes sp.]|nr:UDP-N-acetylmuramate--L-alanine ligase [Synergistes sp.]